MCKWYGMTFGMFVTLSDDCDFSLVQAKQLLGQPKKKTDETTKGDWEKYFSS